MNLILRLIDTGATVLVSCAFALPVLWMAPAAAAVWLAVVAAFALPAVWCSWSFVGWLPTPKADLARIVALAALKPGDRFVELGAGDAHVSVAVQRASGARCTAIERSPFHWLLARLRLLATGTPVELVRGDLFDFDLRTVDAAYLWGSMHGSAGPFADKVRRELAPGVRLISRKRAIRGLEPVRVDRDGVPIYVYVGTECAPDRR